MDWLFLAWSLFAPAPLESGKEIDDLCEWAEILREEPESDESKEACEDQVFVFQNECYKALAEKKAEWRKDKRWDSDASEDKKWKKQKADVWQNEMDLAKALTDVGFCNCAVQSKKASTKATAGECRQELKDSDCEDQRPFVTRANILVWDDAMCDENRRDVEACKEAKESLDDASAACQSKFDDAINRCTAATKPSDDARDRCEERRRLKRERCRAALDQLKAEDRRCGRAQKNAELSCKSLPDDDSLKTEKERETEACRKRARPLHLVFAGVALVGTGALTMTISGLWWRYNVPRDFEARDSWGVGIGVASLGVAMAVAGLFWRWKKSPATGEAGALLNPWTGSFHF